MLVRETWGLSLDRILGFLRSQADIIQSRDLSFRCGACEIRLTELPSQAFGAIRIPRTLVEFDGEDRDTESMRHRFFIQFLSAGG